MIQPTFPYPELDDEDCTSSAYLAGLLDCTTGEISDKARMGLFPHKNRRYHVWESVRNYTRFLRERLANKEGREVIVEANRATAKFKSAQERLTTIKADQLAGRLVNIDEVEAAWVDTMTAIRQAVISIPGRFRFQTPHMTAHDQQVLETICRDVLEELAKDETPKPRTDA